jgi:hypothetical protein
LFPRLCKGGGQTCPTLPVDARVEEVGQGLGESGVVAATALSSEGGGPQNIWKGAC